MDNESNIIDLGQTPQSDITTNLVNCARCGGMHVGITFKPFTIPMPDGGDAPDYTHWTMCPRTKEPVVLRVNLQALLAAGEDNEAPN